MRSAELRVAITIFHSAPPHFRIQSINIQYWLFLRKHKFQKAPLSSYSSSKRDGDIPSRTRQSFFLYEGLATP